MTRPEEDGMRAPKLLRNAAAVLAALLVGLIFSAGAQAAPGDLDPTFSGDGEQVTDLQDAVLEFFRAG